MTEPLLHDAVQKLQQQVAVLQQAAARRHRLALTLVQPQPWLGQAVTLVVQATDEAGVQPRVDLPVLLTATWGRLRVADGYSLQEGESVVARTDLQGVVTATLAPPLTEQLGEPEQRALETQLAQLDGAAASPQHILPALLAFVQQYQQATEQPLRAAVDFYFQRFYQPQPDALTTMDWLQSWRYRQATVMALASAAEATPPTGAAMAPLATTVQGAALVHLRFTEWLGPWLQAYIDLARADEGLRRQFATLKTLTGSAEDLVVATTELVQAAVRNRAGHTGERIEQQVVYGVVTALLDQTIADLPVATRVKLLTGLPPATGAVRNLGSRVGADLGQSAFDLKQALTQSVDNKVGQLSQTQGVLTNRIVGVEGTVGGLQTAFQGKADRNELVTLQGQFAELGKGTQTLTTRLDGLQNNIANVGETLQNFQEKTAAQLDKMLLRDEFVRFQSETSQQVANLSERTEAFQGQVKKLASDVGRFDTSLGKFQLDLRDVQEELKRRPGLTVIQELQATLATLSNTLTTLNSDVTNFRDQVNLRLTNSVSRDDLTQVRTDLGRLLATKIDQRQLDQAFGDVEVRFRNLQTDFSVFSSQFNRLRGDLDSLGNNVSKLRLDLDRIRPRP